jgi:GNAT superfamily N-acetyltransferase
MIIRKADTADLPVLERIAAEMGAAHEDGYFARCLQEQAVQRRTVYIALQDGVALGYVQLNWQPIYAPFRRLGIPEIQDLNVIPAQRQRGAGGLLVDHCENAARLTGATDIGISVGLYPRYGAAQRLYVKKGYVPDGGGITYDDVAVRAGDRCTVDDNLTLKLVKSL